ncbi:MAG TPA: LON peptidase substrate-binding domain-containing protein, partial [Acidobacteriota bacterium]|nr:LON peptidase substrate-binding domain-containing protein [Acidobacteriota bacterium]
MNQVEAKLIPILPVRNTVVFPYVLAPLSVGRVISIEAAQAAALSEDKEVFVVAQRNDVDLPTPNDLYSVGTKAIIKKMAQPRAESLAMAVQGTERAVLIKIEQTEPYFAGRIRLSPVPQDSTTEIEALKRAVLDQVTKAFSLAQPEGV